MDSALNELLTDDAIRASKQLRFIVIVAAVFIVYMTLE